MVEEVEYYYSTMYLLGISMVFWDFCYKRLQASYRLILAGPKSKQAWSAAVSRELTRSPQREKLDHSLLSLVEDVLLQRHIFKCLE